MIGLLCKILGHSRVYDKTGNLIPVTVLLSGPNFVVQKKNVETDGYNAIQLGFGKQSEHRLTKPFAGHLRKFGVPAVMTVREFRDFDLDLQPGSTINCSIFESGQLVDAIGTTKGQGFEGVVKRHHFRGGDMTHGAKGWHRRSGAIGQRLFPGTVRRGLRMPGHMGQVRRTVQNLEVIQVRPGENIMLIKGSVPGSEGDTIVIRNAKKAVKVTSSTK